MAFTKKPVQLTPAQSEIARDRHRFRVINCGRRFGKTTLACWEMLGKALSGSGTRVTYIAPTYQQARDIAWVDLVRICLPVVVKKNESRLELTVRTVDGGSSEIRLRGWESIETERGQKNNLLVLDEVASYREFWTGWHEVLRPTLTDVVGEAMFISTPKGFNHFYDLYNLQLSDVDYKSFHFTSYDNPHLPIAELDKAKREVNADRFSQEYMADFRKTEGLVFKEFEREKHIFSDMGKVKHSTLHVVGVDWGYTNPTAVMEIRRDYDSNYYVVSEWYKRGKTTAEIIEYIQSLRADSYYPDPAEPDRLEECRRAGLNVREVTKDVSARIDVMRDMLKTGKLYVHSSCINLIQEFETYSYKERKAGQNEPEEPIKENDHALDAVGYALFMQPSAVTRQEASVFYPKSRKY